MADVAIGVAQAFRHRRSGMDGDAGLGAHQYRLFHHEGRPIGAALWAFLSEEAEAKLSVVPIRLRPDEWKSGDRCWLVDLIAPGATAENKLAALMLAGLRRTALKGQNFRFYRTGLTNTKRELMKIAEVQ